MQGKYSLTSLLCSSSSVEAKALWRALVLLPPWDMTLTYTRAALLRQVVTLVLDGKPPPKVMCSLVVPPLLGKGRQFCTYQRQALLPGASSTSRGCSAAVEVQDLAQTKEVPQGRDSRNSSRNRPDGNWLLNDSVITQFLLHPHLNTSLFGKITAWLCPDFGAAQQKKHWSLKWCLRWKKKCCC